MKKISLCLSGLFSTACCASALMFVAPLPVQGNINFAPAEQRATPTAPAPRATATKVIVAQKAKVAATPTPAPTEVPDAVIKTALRLREGPDSKFRLLPSPALKRAEPVEIVGHYRNCRWLQVRTANGVEGWLPGTAQFVTLNVPCERINGGIFRPLTGTIIKDNRKARGEGRMTLINQSQGDRVITLVLFDDSTILLASFYVRAQERYVLTRIPDETYRILVSGGDAFNGPLGRFTADIWHTRIKEEFPYKTTARLIPGWKVTLNTNKGPNLTTESIDASDVPDLSEAKE